MSSKGSLPNSSSVEAIKGCQNVLQNDKHWKDNIIWLLILKFKI